ncbi:MAG: hypothetical protein IKG42_05335 [Clostridia bacterium]|nr:hypothetical protein [Clostridia bacterium]
MEVWLDLLGVLICALGIICVYDARPIVKKYFNFGEENEATLGLKLLGFIFIVIGGLIVYFN